MENNYDDGKPAQAPNNNAGNNNNYPAAQHPQTVVIDSSKPNGFLYQSTGTTTYFRSHSVFYTCKKCKYEGPTQTKRECSMLDYCFFYCFAEFWLIYDAYMTKDMNCKNTAHHCGGCGDFLYQYKAIEI